MNRIKTSGIQFIPLRILFILSKKFWSFCLASQHVSRDEGEREHEAGDKGD